MNRDLAEVLQASPEEALSLIEALPPERRELLLQEAAALIRTPVFRDGKGVERVNPLLTAALAEQAFLDGDVPEMRQGPLPYGGTPAVPVKTTSMNPVQVGQKLLRARQEVEERFKLLRGDLTEEQFALAVSEGPDGLSRHLSGVEGYRAGETPSLMEVPEEEALVPLLPEERRELHWSVLSTTQGRRSLAGPIAQRVLELLERKGWKVELVEGLPPEAVETVTAFSVRAFGAGELSTGFSDGENTAAVLAAKINQTGPPGNLDLEVVQVGLPSDRQFGWVARFRGREC